MHNVISAQLYKCFKTKGFYIMLIIAVICTATDVVIVSTTLQSKETEVINGFLSMYDALSGGLFLIFVGIYAAIAYSSDYSSKSIRQIIGKGTKRTVYTLGMLVTVTAVSLIIVAAAYASGFIKGTIFGSGVGSFNAAMMIKFVIAVLVFTFMYVAYTGLIANLTRKTTYTLLITIFTPPLLQMVMIIIKAVSKQDVLMLDPISMMDKAVTVGTPNGEYLTAVIVYFCAGIIFTYMSIIVAKKKDL